LELVVLPEQQLDRAEQADGARQEQPLQPALQSQPALQARSLGPLRAVALRAVARSLPAPAPRRPN